MGRIIKKGSNRAKAQPFLERLAAEGYSANKALLKLREMGLGYKRADFLADWREVKGKQTAKAVGKYVGLDRYPGPACEVTTNRFQRRKYNYVVNYTVTNLETGQEDYKHYIVQTDQRLTRHTIEETALEGISENLDRYGYSLKSFHYSYTQVRRE